MEKGDVVRHTFLRTKYIVERVTPKKAEVRAIQTDGLSANTNMVLRRNLELLTERDKIHDLAEAAFERRDWELKDRIMAYYYKLWPRIPAPRDDRKGYDSDHSSGMYYGIRH